MPTIAGVQILPDRVSPTNSILTIDKQEWNRIGTTYLNGCGKSVKGLVASAAPYDLCLTANTSGFEKFVPALAETRTKVFTFSTTFNI